MGFIDDEKPEGELPAPYIGSLDVLDAYVKERNVDEIYFAWSGEKAQALSRVLKLRTTMWCRSTMCRRFRATYAGISRAGASEP